MNKKFRTRWSFIFFLLCLFLGAANLYKENYLIAAALAICAVGNYLSFRNYRR